MRVSIRFRVLALAAILCVAGAGCGDNENVNIDLDNDNDNGSTRTSTPVRTPTPGAATRTATAAATTTSVSPTPSTSASTSTSPSTSPSPGGNAAQVEDASNALLPFLTIIGFSTSASPNSSALTASNGIPDGASGTDPCPDGGTRTEVDAPSDALPLTITITLAACRINNQLGNFQFDGTIVASVAQGSANFNVTVQDLTNSTTTTYSGTIDGTPVAGGGFVVDGTINIATSEGDLTLEVNNVTVDSDGNVVSGSGTLTDTDDIFADLDQIEVTIRTGTNLADVTATFDDNSTEDFVLNLDTGVLTPA